MIIKESYFKRLLKRACDTGSLVLSNTGTKYIIAGSWWVVVIECEALTKKEKGAIVSMSGDLPDEGEIVKIGKDSRQILI